jgi:hypothetical protein
MKLFVPHAWHRESCPSELYVRLESKLMPSERTIWEAFEGRHVVQDSCFIISGRTFRCHSMRFSLAEKAWLPALF